MVNVYVQVMSAQTAEKTSSSPQLSHMSTVPLKSTRWLAKRPRNRFNTVKQTPIYSPLLHWYKCNQTDFLFMSLGSQMGSAIHLACNYQLPDCSLAPNHELFKSQSVPKVSFCNCKGWISTLLSVLFISRWNFVSHFILNVNYVMFVNVAQYLLRSQVLKRLLYGEKTISLCRKQLSHSSAIGLMTKTDRKMF